MVIAAYLRKLAISLVIHDDDLSMMTNVGFMDVNKEIQ